MPDRGGCRAHAALLLVLSWVAWTAWTAWPVCAQQAAPPAQVDSWDPQLDPWGTEGGRIYATCMLAMAAMEAARHD